MKPTAGYAKPRRSATPKNAISGKTQLNLQRRPKPDPEDAIGTEPKSNFWKWVVLVALLHVLVLGIAYLIYGFVPAPKPPEQFISLLPQGDTVKGTPGAQQAHKVGPMTTASVAHHAASPPPPSAPAAKLPPPPKPITPPPVLRPDVPSTALNNPPPKPVPPKPPKVKVDLKLADAPATAENKSVAKPKHSVKKPAEKPADDETESADSPGLSKEEIAAKLGEKSDQSGAKDTIKTGTSGSTDGHANRFADFYASIHDQVMNLWQSPNVADQNATNPIVHIYVEKNGHVPPESVHLIQSSGTPAIDDSAVSAAKNLGYLHEPLPDGCTPDISITFKPNS